jgi:hypothetical protein
MPAHFGLLIRLTLYGLKAGVRQGDPLGPLLFALNLQDVLHAVAFWNEDVRVNEYLDDGFLQGTVNTLVNAY